MKKGKKKYHEGLPRELYTYFICFTDTAAPSFSKFARSIGVTLEELESFRRHKKFDEAYRECIEIRRDYLIDMALTKRADPSFVKFLLGDERSSGTDEADDNVISVSVSVVD